MSRYAISRHGSNVELPIDQEGFQVVLRPSERLHKLSGEMLWYAGDAADTGVLVVSEYWAYVSDSLPMLLRLLGQSGFVDVRVDMAWVPKHELEEGEEGIPMKPRQVDPWSCALPPGVEAPERPVRVSVEVQSPVGKMVMKALMVDSVDGGAPILRRL